MRIVDRYIESHIFSVYLFVLSLFVGLYFIVDIFSTLSDFLSSKPPLIVIAQYYFNMLPLIFIRVSPFSLLISILYTFGELNKHNELITLRSSGFSLPRIASPAILFAVLISCFALFVQEKILIFSQKGVEDITVRYIKHSSLSTSEASNFPFLSGDEIYLVERFSAKTQSMENVIIFKEAPDGDIISQLVCRTCRYQDGHWVAFDVIEYDFGLDGTRQDPIRWEQKTLSLKETPQDLLYKKSIFVEFTPLKELKSKITRLQKIRAQGKLNPLIAEFHQKITSPFAHFFLIIGALPFALEIKKRKVGFISFGIGFIFYFCYYFLSYFSVALGKEGLLLPFLSAWLAPLFFFTIGITGLSLVK